MTIDMNTEIVVAQTTEEQHPWGVWQFPSITRLADNLLEVTFSRTVDSASLDSARKRHAPVAYRSVDNGATWQEADKAFGGRNTCTLRNGDMIRLEKPPEKDVPKADLPEGTPWEHGYNGVYTIRDPLQMPEELTRQLLMRKPAGKNAWERIPATIDDDGSGITCYDPPDAEYSVVRGRGCQYILELPDGSLLGIFYGARLGSDRKPYPKSQSYCLKSTDGGITWRFHAVIARDDDHQLAGYTEPYVTALPDNSLLAVLRTECAKTGPMYRVRSTDGGKTWTAPAELWPFGVLPQLLTLDNGITVLGFGRPGVHLLFSKDGKGEVWENPIHLVVESFEGTGVKGEGVGFQKGEDPKGRPKQTRTSGYTSLVADGPDSFMIAYDQFDYPNPQGHPREPMLF
ncbi:MAG: glycoside hydrolase [Candidatus Pacebacteria bacterium]|nr:glycoside hydrolase [Candidatus Paceibacterota bacterium]